MFAWLNADQGLSLPPPPGPQTPPVVQGGGVSSAPNTTGASLGPPQTGTSGFQDLNGDGIDDRIQSVQQQSLQHDFQSKQQSLKLKQEMQYWQSVKKQQADFQRRQEQQQKALAQQGPVSQYGQDWNKFQGTMQQATGQQNFRPRSPLAGQGQITRSGGTLQPEGSLPRNTQGWL